MIIFGILKMNTISEDYEEIPITEEKIILKRKKHKKRTPKNLEATVQNIVTRELNTKTKKFISKIHEDIHFRYNSFNIVVGNQGTSKTTTCLKELMKLSYVNHDYHLLIYVTDNESDETFQKLSEYIDFQIIQCKYDEIEDVFAEIIELKTQYNNMVDGKEPEDDYILENLFVNDFKKKRLHTFIMFDDASFIFDKNSKSRFKKWLCQCRHLNITAVCIIQIWGSLDPKLKSQLASVMIGRGFSRQIAQYIHRQVATDIPFETFWETYSKLEQYQKVFFDCIDNVMKVI